MLKGLRRIYYDWGLERKTRKTPFDSALSRNFIAINKWKERESPFIIKLIWLNLLRIFIRFYQQKFFCVAEGIFEWKLFGSGGGWENLLIFKIKLAFDCFTEFLITFLGRKQSRWEWKHLKSSNKKMIAGISQVIEGRFKVLKSF